MKYFLCHIKINSLAYLKKKIATHSFYSLLIAFLLNKSRGLNPTGNVNFLAWK